MWLIALVGCNSYPDPLPLTARVGDDTPGNTSFPRMLGQQLLFDGKPLGPLRADNTAVHQLTFELPRASADRINGGGAFAVQVTGACGPVTHALTGPVKDIYYHSYSERYIVHLGLPTPIRTIPVAVDWHPGMTTVMLGQMSVPRGMVTVDLVVDGCSTSVPVVSDGETIGEIPLDAPAALVAGPGQCYEWRERLYGDATRTRPPVLVDQDVAVVPSLPVPLFQVAPSSIKAYETSTGEAIPELVRVFCP